MVRRTGGLCVAESVIQASLTSVSQDYTLLSSLHAEAGQGISTKICVCIPWPRSALSKPIIRLRLG